MANFFTERVERRRQRVILQGLLREIRQEKGFNQAQFAERLGAPQFFVSRYETGERRLDLLEILHICEALNTPLPQFVERLNERLATPI